MKIWDLINLVLLILMVLYFRKKNISNDNKQNAIKSLSEEFEKVNDSVEKSKEKQKQIMSTNIKLISDIELLEQEKRAQLLYLEHMYAVDEEFRTYIVQKELILIDSMDGYAFEEYVGSLLEKIGYKNIQVTKRSGDQGMDIIANISTTKVGFQCKAYNSLVGNKAVQEGYAGKDFYNLDKAIIITNNYFTNSAYELASKLNVELWNRETIIRYIEDIKQFNVHDKIYIENPLIPYASHKEVVKDELYEQALNFFEESDSMSISMLQRKFRINYMRAAQLFDTIKKDIDR